MGVSPTSPALIVVRGNSGAGKTTVANTLQHALGRGTANIGQDYVRRQILREHDVPGGDNIGLIDDMVRYCLRSGYHVVLEGILLSDHYGEMVRKLVADHLGPTHIFYLDVTLDETLRRHEGRPLRAEVEPHKLREWYADRDLLGIEGEIVVAASELQEGEVVDLLLSAIGTVEPRKAGGAARFL